MHTGGVAGKSIDGESILFQVMARSPSATKKHTLIKIKRYIHGKYSHCRSLCKPVEKAVVSIHIKRTVNTVNRFSQIAKFMGPTWGPPGCCRPQMGPMLAPWTLLSGLLVFTVSQSYREHQWVKQVYWSSKDYYQAGPLGLTLPESDLSGPIKIKSDNWRTAW